MVFAEVFVLAVSALVVEGTYSAKCACVRISPRRSVCPLSLNLIRLLRRRQTTCRLGTLSSARTAAAGPTCSRKFEFSFLNDNLMVPVAHRFIFSCGSRPAASKGPNRRLNMKTLITVLILSIATATPMLAQAASWHSVQDDARGSAAPYGTTEGGRYTPDAPTPAHGFSQDFQDGSRG